MTPSRKCVSILHRRVRIHQRVIGTLTLCNLGSAERLFNDDVATWPVFMDASMFNNFADSPLGPRVTLTALARTSTPFRIPALPSLENLISLCAPRVSKGWAVLAAGRIERADVVERRYILCTTKLAGNPAIPEKFGVFRDFYEITWLRSFCHV